MNNAATDALGLLSLQPQLGWIKSTAMLYLYWHVSASDAFVEGKIVKGAIERVSKEVRVRCVIEMLPRLDASLD